MSVDINVEETTFENSQGFSIFERSWVVEAPKGMVVLTHGIAEHSGRYEHFALSLCQAGYSVVGFDLRGHGRSSGQRNYINAFDDYLDDLEAVLERIQRINTKDPVFLFGHSMGGGIVALYAIERAPQVAGILLSAPSAKVSDDLSPFLQKISGVLSLIAPKLPAVKLDNAFISKDPKVREDYDNDPLNYRKGILARTGSELLKSTKKIGEGCGHIDLPILIMHGMEDKLADISGSEMLYQNVASSDKTFKQYEGLYHEILNEPERDRVKADIIAWLDAHV